MDLTVISGPNFSGRTARLRKWVGLPDNQQAEPTATENAFVGLDADEAISGLAPTVLAEYELCSRDAGAMAGVRQVTEDLGFGHILDQNPFTLSGGEQAVAAVLAAMAGRPKRLAIDCALEQLAPHTREALLAWLAAQDGELMLADNRLDEWYGGPAETMDAAPNAPELRQELFPTGIPTAPEIEIVDLVFAYPKGRRIFDRFNLRLEAGGMYHLRGANGAGKSTLSKLLCGLLRPQKGEIRVEGKRVEPWKSPGSLIRYHFQNPNYQMFSGTVSEQVGGDSNTHQSLEAFGLDRFADTHPLDLPFVLRKRVTLANLVRSESRTLIVDEPTLGQDSRSSQMFKTCAGIYGGLIISHSGIYAGLPQVNL